MNYCRKRPRIYSESKKDSSTTSPTTPENKEMAFRQKAISSDLIKAKGNLAVNKESIIKNKADSNSISPKSGFIFLKIAFFATF